MDRRTFLKTTGAGALLAGSGVTWAQATLKPLPILPLADLTAGFDGRFELALTKGAFDFGNGAASDTFGINSPYLGQQLRVKRGQDLPFDVVNNLDEVAAIHWHGLHIPGEVDGGPHQEIEPGRRRNHGPRSFRSVNRLRSTGSMRIPTGGPPNRCIRGWPG